ncbi:hypothetical protein [Corynebacterium tuberculostearicum]
MNLVNTKQDGLAGVPAAYFVEVKIYKNYRPANPVITGRAAETVRAAV